MAKMWAGRTSGVTDSIADDFNSSIRFDCKMYKQDITGSMAHAAMLGAKGIIAKAEADQLIDGLQGILDDLDSGKLEFDFSCEDIHMFVEQVLTQRLGDVGKKLHTARSRNDQVALDIRLYLREALSAFVTKTQENVTGKVRLKLYKGNMINAGVWSPYSLYSEEIATFGESDYNQKDAEGFINLYGLPIKVQAMVNGKK